MSIVLKTACLLMASNLFMTFAWYAHLKDMKGKPWLWAVVFSWGVAFFEYLIQVPANRLGDAGGLTLGQLKVLQEVIALAVFIPFAIFYMRDQRTPWSDYLLASGCLLGAAYFMFRSRLGS
jgi:uncharacterized protein (DUF486 family)